MNISAVNFINTDIDSDCDSDGTPESEVEYWNKSDKIHSARGGTMDISIEYCVT
jgi:hypothetical protein